MIDDDLMNLIGLCIAEGMCLLWFVQLVAGVLP